MKRNLKSLIWIVLFASLVSAAYSQPKPKKTPVDPQAMRILKSMSDFLGGLKRFSYKVVNMREDIRGGHRVDFEVATQVTVERPNRLKAVREGHLLDQEIYYNGTSLVVYSPTRKIYSSVDAPDSIDATLKYARTVLGVGYPAADLIYTDTFPLLTKGVISASVIGKEMIAGKRCDHLLFSLPGVDFQIWIADSGEPLPYKYIVTDTATVQLLSIVAILSSWNLSHPTEDRDFNFIPPEGTRQIPFRTVDGKSKAERAPARTKST